MATKNPRWMIQMSNVSDDLKAEISRLAASEDRTVSSMIKRLLEEAVAARKKG